MKNLLEYITEKMVFNSKNTNNKLREIDLTSLSSTHDNIILKYIKDFGILSPAKQESHYNKMKQYQDKGSSPKRLANSIKDKSKLIYRWYTAIQNGWIDCAAIFRDEIIDRNYCTENEIDGAILYEYNKLNSANKKYLESRLQNFSDYLTEIGVKHDKYVK